MSSAGAARTRPISTPALTSISVNPRSSVRKFTDAVIPEADLRQVLEQAGRAASGGNVQPWKVWVLGPGWWTALLRLSRTLSLVVGRRREGIHLQGMEQ